jgi:hypothetical protein
VEYGRLDGVLGAMERFITLAAAALNGRARWFAVLATAVAAMVLLGANDHGFAGAVADGAPSTFAHVRGP